MLISITFQVQEEDIREAGKPDISKPLNNGLILQKNTEATNVESILNDTDTVEKSSSELGIIKNEESGSILSNSVDDSRMTQGCGDQRETKRNVNSKIEPISRDDNRMSSENTELTPKPEDLLENKCEKTVSDVSAGQEKSIESQSSNQIYLDSLKCNSDHELNLRIYMPPVTCIESELPPTYFFF